MTRRSPQPTLYTCPCGENVRTYLKGRGGWHIFVLGIVSPIFTAGLYLAIVVIALSDSSDLPDVARPLLLAPIPVLYLLTWITLGIGRHRGWCRLKRSTYYFFVWPGALLLAVV